MSRVKIPWRTKALIFRIFEGLPCRETGLNLLRRYVSKTLPRPHSRFPGFIELVRTHFHHIKQFSHQPLHEAHVLEFGAGWDLFHSLTLYQLGVLRQTAIDISALVKPEYLNHVLLGLKAEGLGEYKKEVCPTLTKKGWCTELFELFGIRYRAPLSLSSLDGSYDVICSTNTFEHIPAEALDGILGDFRRLLAPHGIASLIIDYSDHYSHSDKTITPYNYLQFSGEEWKKYNPNTHHQNRWRHVDYRRLFEKKGFKVLSEGMNVPIDAEKDLRQISIAEEYLDYGTEELLPQSGRFVIAIDEAG